jgi:pimeloyl-ACP methyl ester carboxylesterase
MKKFIFFFAFFIIISFITACFGQKSQSSETAAINFTVPQPSGKYGVGRQLIYLTDERRKQSERQRELAVWIYYPAEKSKNAATELVLPLKWAESYRNFLEKRIGKTAADALAAAQTTARTDLSVVSGKDLYPVLIFAPGANWLPTDYSAIIEDLASSGYAVVAFASAPLSPVIQFSDGSVAASPRVDEATYGIVSDDFRFLAGEIGRLNEDTKLKIKGRLDVGKIGTFGHSIGGAAAISAASNNPRITTAINLDGDFSGETANAAPEQAILYLTTEPPNLKGAPVEKWDEDRSETRRKGVWEKINANSARAVRVRLAKMFHINFADVALLPVEAIPENLRNNRFGTIDGARGVQISNELIRAFFDHQLKARAFDDFLKIEKQFPEIKIETKTK